MNSGKKTMVARQSTTSRAIAVKLGRLLALSTSACFGVTLSGCTALTQPIDGVPATRLPRQFFEGEKNNLVPIDISLLAKEVEREYTLGPGDILGVSIDRILPFAEPDQIPPLPPVNFPDRDSTLPPSTGFPITILADGTISLPLLSPIEVEGLTTDQTRDKIRQAYLDSKILREDEGRKISPVVTIIKKRQVNVVVIRQDQENAVMTQRGIMAGSTGRLGVDYSASGQTLMLDSDRADILNALMETGGLPGVAAKNEIKVLRNTQADKAARQQFMQQYAQVLATYSNPCSCPPPMPEDPTILRIPLRLPPGILPSITPQDVALEEGDIVLIETRDTEFFFTGGLLPGGQWAIPRDYDLDALGAMAVAGYGVSGQSRGVGLTGIAGSAQVVPPGRLYILRQTPCNGQIAIEVDLASAINDPGQRPIIQPGDTLILQYRPCEELLNFGMGAFFTFGIRELFR
jgi:protein involved in polysaccharide export with SLBB domain